MLTNVQAYRFFMSKCLSCNDLFNLYPNLQPIQLPYTASDDILCLEGSGIRSCQCIREPFTLYARTNASGKKVYYYRTYDKNGKRTTGRSTGLISRPAAKLFL